MGAYGYMTNYSTSCSARSDPTARARPSVRSDSRWKRG
ncbi:BQ5605_C016g08193 [Microbotryum silenes-dioicae]|uniref:BQ5605_C016g08193 protein n=1 Tax=Microbotryum silenes-dioicae TaxID=796604 RepID=A0A2X0LZI0_9BASI|nr:BQ5605_C016g08193 [Microbotryum silenes-dioicae]